MFETQPRALPGSSVFGLPYDYEWTVPNTQLTSAATDRNAGTLRAFALGFGVQRTESGAGLGLALTSPSTVDVRLSAYMPIHYDWSALIIDDLLARVDGLARIIVFRDDGTVVLHRTATLFDRLFQAGAWDGHDDTYIGYTSAANPVFQMQAGRTYFAWHYGIVGAVGNAAGSAIDCSIPFIVVAPV